MQHVVTLLAILNQQIQHTIECLLIYDGVKIKWSWCNTYGTTLMMEAAWYSEQSVDYTASRAREQQSSYTCSIVLPISQVSSPDSLNLLSNSQYPAVLKNTVWFSKTIWGPYEWWADQSLSLFLGTFAKLRKAAISFVAFVCTHRTIWIPLDWFSCNFMYEDFPKICRESSSFIKIGQE
jgi:hypothetical protein